MKTFSLSVVVTAAVWCGALIPALAQELPDQTQSSTIASGTDQLFLRTAIEANAAEIELGRIAEARSENPRVRAFAAMMVRDHTDALNSLLRLASGSVTASPTGGPGSAQAPGRIILSKEHQQLRDRLSRLSGIEFDQEYAAAMLQEHRKEIRDFEREARSGPGTTTDSTVNPSDPGRQKPQADATAATTEERSIARDLLPTLRMHLKQAESLERELGSGSPEPVPGSNGPRHQKNQ